VDSLKYWSPETFEISSYKFSLDKRKSTSFIKIGTDASADGCLYRYNELGFRGDSISKEGFKIMSIGCSFTEGVGVNDDETWPAQFAKLIPNSVDMNFGAGGRSNDFISRCLLTYYDLINPDLVLIMYTNPSRREIYTKDGGIEPFIPTSSFGWLKHTDIGRETQNQLIELQNDNEDFINWYKNHILIKYFLELKKCNWLWNGNFKIPKNYIEYNRFDGDYEKYLDMGTDGSHPGPMHNRVYANKLYDFIKENYPNYLYDSSKNKKAFSKII
jgi:lysophospholipase L1-like esterase